MDLRHLTEETIPTLAAVDGDRGIIITMIGITGEEAEVGDIVVREYF